MPMRRWPIPKIDVFCLSLQVGTRITALINSTFNRQRRVSKLRQICCSQSLLQKGEFTETEARGKMTFPTNISAVEMNSTHHDEAALLQDIFHDAAHIKGIKMAAYTMLLAVSLVGNFFLITVAYKNTNQRMRTASNYFVVNMACSDILLTVYFIPQNVALTANDSQWLIDGVTGDVFCRLFIFITHMSLLLSTESLFIIAWDRFFLVFFPLKRMITRRTARRIIVIIWLFSIIFTAPLFRLASLVEFYGLLFCNFDFENIMFVFIYFVFCFTTIIVLLLLVTIILYIAIGIKLKKTNVPGDQLSSSHERRDRMNSRLLAVLLTVVVVLITCRFPLLLGTVACFSGVRTAMCSSPDVFFAGWFLTLANSGLNPWIYVIFNEQFRRGARVILKNKMPCCFSSMNEVDAAQSLGLTRLQTQSQQRKIDINRKLIPRPTTTLTQRGSHASI